ncbi:DeoR/GlpR family DNA-binding transcription regulator [Olivibacter ginsenosidimutans]|uniref:DeoR/GlpR family DNA-binding transcription regulator n=1 Tax=Olivibacter ginsenosidimutans TaxID=1176537 RepID=A0ABP9BEC5_9SPHI
MIKAERQQRLTAHVKDKQTAQLAELSRLLNVSEDTVRRDIKELADLGIIKAVRGGAIAHSPVPPHFRDREHLQVAQKEIIAQKALHFIENGQVVFFDGGTSSLAVAAALPPDKQIVAVTNSFPIATILEDHPLAEVLFFGGRLNKKSFTTVGIETIEAIRNVRADVSFLGICSIDLAAGITTVDYDDALIKRSIVMNSKNIIALSTINKLETAESFYVCPVDAIDVILTDAEVDAELYQAFQERGVAIQ